MEIRFTSTGMQVIPYSPKKCKPILNSRSIWVPGSHTFNNVTAFVMKDAEGQKRLVTYGCGIDFLKQILPDYEITKMPKEVGEKIEQEFSLNDDIIPSDVQSSAVEAVITNNFTKAFFNIPTGVGKTLMSLYLTSLLKRKAWVMCYRTIVLDQWDSTLENMTSFDTRRCLHVKSSKQLLKMATGDFDFHKYDIYLSTPMLLIKFASTFGLDYLNDVMVNCGIGVKFFDEAHKNVGNICKINALTNVARTYYLSADFGQSGEAKRDLYYKMFGTTPVIRPKQELLQDMRYTNAIVVKYNTHPNILETESVFTGHGFSAYRFMDYTFPQPEFRDALYQTLRSVIKANPNHHYRVLILCNLIRQTDELKELVTEIYQNVCNEIGADMPFITRYHSEVSKEEQEEAKLSGDVIVSTHQSMGVGVDMKMIRYVINLAPVNFIEDNQAAGRARQLPDKEDCFYFMFCDEGFDYVRKRLPERLDYLKGQKVKKIYSIQYSSGVIW